MYVQRGSSRYTPYLYDYTTFIYCLLLLFLYTLFGLAALLACCCCFTRTLLL